MIWLPPGPAGRGYVFAVVVVVADVVVTAVVLRPEEDAVVGTVVTGAVVCTAGEVLCADGEVLCADGAVVPETAVEDGSDSLDTGGSPAAHPLNSTPARQSAKSCVNFFFIPVHLIVLE